MKRKLKKIQEATREYEYILARYPKQATEKSAEFQKDIEILIAILDIMIEQSTEKFKNYCEVSVMIFNENERNIFTVIKKKIELRIVNHFLCEISQDLRVAKKRKENLIDVKRRLIQYQYLR